MREISIFLSMSKIVQISSNYPGFLENFPGIFRYLEFFKIFLYSRIFLYKKILHVILAVDFYQKKIRDNFPNHERTTIFHFRMRG